MQLSEELKARWRVALGGLTLPLILVYPSVLGIVMSALPNAKGERVLAYVTSGFKCRLVRMKGESKKLNHG